MSEAPTSWISPKTLTAYLTAGLGVIGSLVFGWFLVTSIPETQVLAQDIKNAVMQAVIPKIDALIDQHNAIAPKLEEGNRIQCAQCWNDADSPEEVKRCNCSPNR